MDRRTTGDGRENDTRKTGGGHAMERTLAGEGQEGFGHGVYIFLTLSIIISLKIWRFD